jgi:metal-responsive CopG/Arc/MetJ family transcriptional regulator
MGLRSRKREWLSGSKSPTYLTVKLPVRFVQKIDIFLERNPGMGYTSRSDFIKDASRRLLEGHGTLNVQENEKVGEKKFGSKTKDKDRCEAAS